MIFNSIAKESNPSGFHASRRFPQSNVTREKTPPKRGRSSLVHHPVEQRVEHTTTGLVLRHLAGIVGVQRLVHL